MHSLKVFPGISRGSVEHYFKDFYLEKVYKLSSEISSFECTAVSLGVPCKYKLMCKNAIHTPGEYVSTIL
jgi:hypothetical protein